MQPQTTILDADGSALFSLETGREYVLTAAGNFGTGTVTVEFEDGAGNAFALPEPGSTDASEPFERTAAFAVGFIAPAAAVEIELADATEPDLSISIAPAAPTRRW
jgi:hypothetical protein